MGERPGDRYPEIEPYEQGMLDVGDGHRVYCEAGHGSGPGLAGAIVDATDRFASRHA